MQLFRVKYIYTYYTIYKGFFCSLEALTKHNEENCTSLSNSKSERCLLSIFHFVNRNWAKFNFNVRLSPKPLIKKFLELKRVLWKKTDVSRAFCNVMNFSYKNDSISENMLFEYEICYSGSILFSNASVEFI